MSTKKPDPKGEEAPTKRCFMITPIGTAGSAVRKHADWVFKYASDACSARGYALERADTMTGSPMITSRIFEAVQKADVCIADLTGLNANVFYELGVRHSLEKPVIHIAAEDTALPFDNAQHDTIFFDISTIGSMDALTAAIERQLREIERTGYQVSNPFTAALGAINLQHSPDTRDQVMASIVERLSKVEQRIVRAQTLPPAITMKMLTDVIESARKEGRLMALDAGFVTSALNNIPADDPAQPQALVNQLAGAITISNRWEMIELIKARFPEVYTY